VSSDGLAECFYAPLPVNRMGGYSPLWYGYQMLAKVAGTSIQPPFPSPQQLELRGTTMLISDLI
jgi:hypothetical protein